MLEEMFLTLLNPYLCYKKTLLLILKKEPKQKAKKVLFIYKYLNSI